MKTANMFKLVLLGLLAHTSLTYADTAEKSMSFDGVQQFRLINFAANVDIQTHDAADGKASLDISAENDLDKYLEHLDITNSGGVLTLTDKRTSGDKIIIKMDSFGLMVNGIILEWSKPKELPSVVIHLPKQTPLDLSMTVGKLKIGDLSAPLNLSLKGAATATVGKINGDTRVSISGSGDLDSKAIFGDTFTATISGAGSIHAKALNVQNALLEIKGAGDINVEDGQVVQSLNAAVKGAGSCSLDVTAGQAELAVKGVGSIHVKEVTGNVNQSVSGLGKIYVGKR